ncbi:TIGR03792 family protein [Botrimarina hoheduenensis]|uniref:Antibiotic biosynthesis monooxygenase n=1 Tax=Botrimarina hoheduenensis TaxID=2528000 RepID=A0A5C5VSA8_9BACT|nr:TIGR03792 family protein [Botrimarina hoheduenensis]TWT40775.1 Antibiotic biosynthesis monooxygenase [Botrimarina hoheduenensis]
MSRQALATLWLALGMSAAPTGAGEVIEELIFQVAPEARAEFLRADRVIWTTALETQPGFLGKETLLPASNPDQVRLQIRWRSQADWDAVPADLLAQADRLFRAALPETDFRMLSARGLVIAPTRAVTHWRVSELLTTERLALTGIVSIPRDPVYHMAKRFIAVPLTPVIEAATKDWHPARVDRCVVVFDCVDDYRSQMPLRRFLSQSAWLAFRDAEAPQGQRWMSDQGPAPAKMGEAYVVWPGVDTADRSFTWPYAVTRVRLLEALAAADQAADPQPD